LTFTRVVEESVCTPGVDVAVLRAARGVGEDEDVRRLRRGADPALSAATVAPVQLYLSDPVSRCRSRPTSRREVDDPGRSHMSVVVVLVVTQRFGEQL
jgi:hypothetical protein